MDLKDLKAIIDLMKKNSITELELEQQEFKIRLKRAGAGAAIPADEATMIPYPGPMALPHAMPSPLPTPTAASNDVEIKSPMIGTFYRSPSPEANSYVDIGSEVNPDTVVCIIEAMKVMNEIKAEAKGVITQILIENAKPVEFGQALFKIRPT